MKSAQRIAIVTGASQGIGLATGLALLDAGHKVVFTDRKVTDISLIPLEKQQNAFCEILDVTDTKGAERLVDRLVQQHGSIDILVNNAGISLKNSQGQSNGVLAATVDEFNAMMNVNVMAVMQLSQIVLPHMIEKRWGRIVNIASLAGRTKSIVAGPVYMMTKSAVIGLTRSIATEMGQFGVTCNAVAPGRILTEMAMQAGEKVNHQYGEQIPVKRIGDPAEVAAAVAYLCDERAGFTNGAVIDVNGGFFMN